jgi:hypothetical protein
MATLLELQSDYFISMFSTAPFLEGWFGDILKYLIVSMTN